MSALCLLETRTYSDSYSPSLGVEYASCDHPSFVCGRPVFGREFLNSVASGLVACCSSLEVSLSVTLDRGLDLPADDLPGGLAPLAIFNLSSVAFSRASRASSSEVWEDTAFFLQQM